MDTRTAALLTRVRGPVKEFVMLFSLFGELGPRRWPSASHAPTGADELAMRVEDTDVVVESDTADE